MVLLCYISFLEIPRYIPRNFQCLCLRVYVAFEKNSANLLNQSDRSIVYVEYLLYFQDSGSLLKKSFPCAVVGCSKQFSTPYRLKAHIRSHTGDMFECDSQGCDKAFITQSDLNKHIKTHSGMKPFQCLHNGCGKVYTTAHHLKVIIFACLQPIKILRVHVSP